MALLYTYSDIHKAEAYVDEIFASNISDPIDSSELYFMMGNISLLSGNQEDAKQRYNQMIDNLTLDDNIKAKVLNNLAFSSWVHLLDIKKLKEKNAEGQKIFLEAQFVESYLKQSI